MEGGKAIGCVVTGLVTMLACLSAIAAPLPDDLIIVDSASDTGFGEAISRLGDVNGDSFSDFAVCVPRKKHPDGSQGEVRIFLGSAEGVTSTPDAILRAPTATESFGFRVAGGDLNQDGFGDAVVLGVPPDGANTNQVMLTLWVYFGSRSGLQLPVASAFVAPTESGPLGFAFIGDVNGDGFPDVAVGLPANHQDDGELLVFHGSPAGQWDAPNSRIRGSQPGEYLGSFGRSHSDFNRDGFDDLLVGSPHYHQWADHNGRVQLFLGSKDGLQTNAAWTATFPPFRARRDIDSNHHQYFGNFIVVDDFNRDGVSDAVITAPFAGQNDLGEGMVFAYHGTQRSPGLSAAFNWSVQANRANSSLGLMAERIGDVNGDGYPDLLVGAPDFGNQQVREGLAAVFFGSRRGFSREPGWTLESQENHRALGLQGAGVGDLNGDGFDDLVVAQNGSSSLAGFYPISVGAIRVIYGSPTGPRRSTEITFGKPVLQWLTHEWGYLSLAKRSAVVSTGLVLLGLAGLGGRRIWRKRTIILVEQGERRSRVEERERLARDLHDELGSRISRIHLIAEMVREDPGFPGTIRTFTDTLSQEAKDMRTAIERLASSLEPSADTTDGLVRALSQHANSFFSGTSTRCFQELPIELPSVQLSEGVRAELFPCVREALANVLRHSQASEVWFKVRWEDSLLKISLEDNGVGFPSSTARMGNGLRNFRTRMASVGGKVEIRSTPGSGTVVGFEVPTSPKEGIEEVPGSGSGIGLPFEHDPPNA